MSWEACNWVMDKSGNKGGNLFCLFLIANDMNSEGRGSFPTVSKLARQLRMPERSVTRILHRLEKSGELRCEVRGSGRTRSQWLLPGVLKDGYADGARGVKLSPLGSQIGTSGMTKRHLTPDQTSSVPSTGSSLPLERSTYIPPPPPKPAVLAEKASTYAVGEIPDDLIDYLGTCGLGFDLVAAHKLWTECQKARPNSSAEDVIRAIRYKGTKLTGAKNPVGVIISVVPAILQAWGPVGIP